MTLDDLHAALEPIRAQIDALPEAEREPARRAVADAVARKIFRRATTEDGIYRRIMPPQPMGDPGPPEET